MADGTHRLAGSAFFLGNPKQDATQGAEVVYAVTAKHVIDQIRKKGVTDVWFRVNTKSGQAEWSGVALSSWFTHPTDASIDVAVVPVTVGNLDHLVLPYSLCATESKMAENEIGLGDEVFVTGLFRHHHGSLRNIPIVRVGNLACLTEERIATSQYGDIDGYLIECRSIGGLSGSPVFVNLGNIRVLGGQLKLGTKGPQFFLLGLVHGHFDVGGNEIDSLVEDSDAASGDRVNTGIAIVVPFSKIHSVISAYEATRVPGE